MDNLKKGTQKDVFVSLHDLQYMEFHLEVIFLVALNPRCYGFYHVKVRAIIIDNSLNSCHISENNLTLNKKRQ